MTLAVADLATRADSRRRTQIAIVRRVLLEIFRGWVRVSATFVRQEAIQQEDWPTASFAHQDGIWRALQRRPLMRACRVQWANGAMSQDFQWLQAVLHV